MKSSEEWVRVEGSYERALFLMESVGRIQPHPEASGKEAITSGIEAI